MDHMQPYKESQKSHLDKMAMNRFPKAVLNCDLREEV
jgi:hypothetical protein